MRNDNYTNLLTTDKSIIFKHKQAWNDLVSNL